MLAARPHIEPRRRADAHTVVVKEIYLSLQGESSHAGMLCTFVRLTGCHLRCSYCDSEFAFQRRRADEDRGGGAAGEGAGRADGGGHRRRAPAPARRLPADGGAARARASRCCWRPRGAIDVRLVPPAVHKIVDLKTPSSGECDRNDYRGARLDERATTSSSSSSASREDYEWARALVREHGLLDAAVRAALLHRVRQALAHGSWRSGSSTTGCRCASSCSCTSTSGTRTRAASRGQGSG